MRDDLSGSRPAYEMTDTGNQFGEGRHAHEFYGIISIHADGVFLCDSTGNELSLSILDGIEHFEGRPVRIRGVASNSKLLAWSIEPTYDLAGFAST